MIFQILENGFLILRKWISNIIKWIFYNKKKSIIVHISLPYKRGWEQTHLFTNSSKQLVIFFFYKLQ